MAKRKTSEKKLIRSLDTTGFYTDCDRPGALYAALVRSPASAGKIQSITISDLPEGYFLYTAKDIPGDKKFRFNSFTTKIFGFSDIEYTGEPLGIIIGPDENVLEELLKNVSINLDVNNLESALNNVIKKQSKAAASDSTESQDVEEQTENFSEMLEQINDMPSLNTVISKSTVEENPNVTVATREVKYGLYQEKTVEEADKELFGEDYIVSKDTWKQRLISPHWQEAPGAFCYMEGSNLHVYTATNWTGLTQKMLAAVIGIASENIYIHKTKISGIYPTGLWRTSQLACQAALACYLSKKPVKLILSQKEQERYVKPGVKTHITYQTAADKKGFINALKISIDIDIGNGNPFAQEITDRITLAACNYYRPKNLYIFTNTHKSKNPPTSISIKVVDSQAFFAIENEIQKVCNKTQMLPDEIRMLNSEDTSVSSKNSSSDFPFNVNMENLSELLQSVISKSDFNRKYASFHMEAIDRTAKDSKPFFALPLRGIGISTGYVVSGYNGSSTFSYDSKIEVTLYPEEKLVIHCIKPSSVIQEIWKNTASEILGISKQNITIDSNFNYYELPENPEDTNSSIGILNEVIKKCCNEIQKKRFHQALPITSKRSTPKPTKAKWNKESFQGTPFVTPSSAATVVEVELDTYTYSEKIKGIWITIDCGEIFDEAAARSSVRLEIQQELGMLVKGKVVSCDAINIKFIHSSNKAGQVGGLVHNTLPAAFSSALSLALTTQLTELPCTEDLLFQLIRNRTETSLTELSDKGEVK